ncbi:MAG TPA: LssY C-terminal domain-containing protein [Dongiaceae bacterium]|nr:LssY C-terminal domain-containing protein [Dongiaceae bacterium]
MNAYGEVSRSLKRTCPRKEVLFARTVLAIVLCGLATLPANAAEDAFPKLRVEKKASDAAGTAMVTIAGKNKVLARHATQAWTVMNGENALVSVAAAKKPKGTEYHLRFYEGATRKYRDLGTMPFPPEKLEQAQQSDGSWVFVLTGTFLGKPTIVLTGRHGVNGMLRNASEPKLHDDQITFLDANGNPKTLPVKPLVAADLTGIYLAPAQDAAKVKYVQFLRTGTAILVRPDGTYRSAPWRTNGEEMIVTEPDNSEMRWRREALAEVSGIPATTRLVVRLLQPLSSERTKEGDKVEAALISPGTIQDKILLPQGTIFSGEVTDVHKLGWGFRRETAGLTLVFTSAKLPDGTVLPVHTRLDGVENARESVNEKGMIQGIRSTGTPAYSAERKIASVSSIDPVSYLFTSVTAVAVLGFAEPAIQYNAGTEVLMQFLSPVPTDKVFPRSAPEFAESEEEKLGRLVHELPFRTATQGTNKPSDITNLVFIGPPEGLRRAFKAAGWVIVDSLTASSGFRTIKAVGGNQVYNQAPMSTLLLDERPPILTLTKTTNTFNSRHHLRVFDPAMSFEGQVVLTSSSTQDIRVAVSYKHKTFIHVIDEYIDNERSKVVNDLEFTGCVSAMNLVPRPWVPQDAYNATGDRLRTDGAVAVMRISDCENPRTTPDGHDPGPGRFQRSMRNSFLYVRDDIYRGNLIYTGVSGAIWLRKYLKTKDELKPETGAWRTTDQSGTLFKGVGEMPRDTWSSSRRPDPEFRSDRAVQEQNMALEKAHRWDPPHYELGIFGGYMRYPNVRNEAVFYSVAAEDNASDVFATLLADEFENGGVAGISVTVNSWKWFSSQFTFSYTRSTWNYSEFDLLPTQANFFNDVPLATRQFEYNLMWNLRPPKSRWRPYLAAGPALLLTNLTDNPITKARGPFKLGLQNVGLLLAAYDFGSRPPLDGGGVFSLGAVYGAGVKFRVHPRITINFDFRETLSRAPKFLADSYTREFFQDEDFNTTVLQLQTEDRYRQDRVTAGISYTF